MRPRKIGRLKTVQHTLKLANSDSKLYETIGVGDAGRLMSFLESSRHGDAIGGARFAGMSRWDPLRRSDSQSCPAQLSKD